MCLDGAVYGSVFSAWLRAHAKPSSRYKQRDARRTFWHCCGEDQTSCVIFHSSDYIIANVWPCPLPFYLMYHTLRRAGEYMNQQAQMAQRLAALDKQVADPDFCIVCQPKFMTNRAEGIIMYHYPPGSHGSIVNCVAWLVKHLTLCLLMREWLYQSHPVSGAVVMSDCASANQHMPGNFGKGRPHCCLQLDQPFIKYHADAMYYLLSEQQFCNIFFLQTIWLALSS